MKHFDHALLAGGSAAALFLGVATAEFGLAPVRQAVAATAPSLDTMVAETRQPVQTDLENAYDAAPAALIRPMLRDPPANADEQAPTIDGNARRADGGDVAAEDPSPEGDPSVKQAPAPEATEDDGQGRVAPATPTGSAFDAASPMAPG